MGLLVSREQYPERKVENFAEKRTHKCMNCGTLIENPHDLYTRRFCSVSCKNEFVLK